MNVARSLQFPTANSSCRDRLEGKKAAGKQFFPAASEGRWSERDPGAEPPDPGALNLFDVAGIAAIETIELLKNRVLVGHVETIRRNCDVRRRRDRYDFLETQIDFVNVLVALIVETADRDVPNVAIVADRADIPVDRIALPAVDAARDVEVQRQLVETVDVELPLGVQEHAVLGSAARRTNRDRRTVGAACTRVKRLRVPGVGRLAGNGIGRIDA